MALINIALYCSKAEIRVPVVVGGGWCKPIFVSNPQPSCFGLLLGWVAVAWLGFGVMTIILKMGIPIRPFKNKPMNNVDTSGNYLRLLGSASFFITIPQVLGEKVERVEAAVLADNDVDSEMHRQLPR